MSYDTVGHRGPLRTSLIASFRRIFPVVMFLHLMANKVESGAVLQLQMLSYDNSASRNWDGTCCDTFCWSRCDHMFTFSLDLSTGNDDSKHYYYWTQKTGEYGDQNVNTFSSNMNGVTNPIIYQFNTPGWPGAIKFKVFVEENDGVWSGNDPVDGIVQLLQLTPAASQSAASWNLITMRGVRPSQKTTLSMNYKLYCQPNYFSPDCTVYCVASDSNAGHYTCEPNTGRIVCRSGWRDPSSMCTRPSDNCIGNQCQNGATCVNIETSYTCTCAAGYTGLFCSVNINECASNPCQNFGTCTDLVGAFTCRCPPAFVGPTCSQPYCNAYNPCRNGGTCFGAGFCQCPTGFIGSDCSTNRCERVVCSNGGTCFNGTCTCSSSFTGSSCDLIQCLSSFCKNGGTCFNGTCRCLTGFTGVNCEININECSSNPCQNGATCTDLVAGFRCTCPVGFAGSDCSQTHCAFYNSSCRNGGSCYGAGQCRCPARFAGADCLIDRCDILVCNNGGNCTADGTCSCPLGFVGATCDINQCNLINCMNGGSCQASNCTCPAGYTGRLCEINIDDCSGDPCDNDGTCKDLVNGYECDCLPDWTGSTCSQPIQLPSNSSSTQENLSLYVQDQPSINLNPVDIWFYASFCIIFLLLVIIIILSAILCRKRRTVSVTSTTSVVEQPATRVECVGNSYSEVVIKGIGGCSSTDKDYDDDRKDDDDVRKYQSIKGPPSPPPRYSTVEDSDPSDLVFYSTGDDQSQKV